MTNPDAVTAHRANPIPPEGIPVLLIVEGYDDLYRSLLTELAQAALPGVRAVAVSNMDMACVALTIHGPDIIGVTTNMRIGGGPKRVIDMVETELGRAVPWGILTGALIPPSLEEFPHPPVAIVEKTVGIDEVREFFRLFAPSPSPEETTAS